MNQPAFTGVDVGAPRNAGKTTSTQSEMEILAGGADIWGTRDEFHYACLRVAGDFELSARLDSVTMADVYTKAGLMLRTSLEPGAEHAFLLAFGDNQPRNGNNGGLEFQYRAAPDGTCRGIYPPQPLPPEPEFPATYPDVWLRLVRESDTLTGYYGNDRSCAKLYCRHLQHFPYAAYLGLAVTSHNPERTVRAVFSQVQFRGNLIVPGTR
jgi:hypothetical protein